MKRIPTAVAAIALTASLAACGNSAENDLPYEVTSNGDLAPAAGEIGETKVGERHSFGYYRDEVSAEVTEITSGGQCRFGEPVHAEAPPEGWKLVQIFGDAEAKTVSNQGTFLFVTFLGSNGDVLFEDDFTEARHQAAGDDTEGSFICPDPEPAAGYLSWGEDIYEGDKHRYYDYFVIPEHINKVQVETAVYDLTDAQPNTEVVPRKREEL